MNPQPSAQSEAPRSSTNPWIVAGGFLAAAGLFFAAYRSYKADRTAAPGPIPVGTTAAPLGSNPNNIPPYQPDPGSPQIA